MMASLSMYLNIKYQHFLSFDLRVWLELPYRGIDVSQMRLVLPVYILTTISYYIYRPNNMDNLKWVTLEEQEFGEEECETEVKNESEEMKEDTCPGVIKLTNT